MDDSDFILFLPLSSFSSDIDQSGTSSDSTDLFSFPFKTTLNTLGVTLIAFISLPAVSYANKTLCDTLYEVYEDDWEDQKSFHSHLEVSIHFI